MIVEFKRLVARDTFAYRLLDFNFIGGIHSVVGANGASKTSIFMALMQCLFNRNDKGIKVDDVNNDITGQPYEIEVWFDKGESKWHIKNSKKTGKIEIYETTADGVTHKRHFHRIPENLKLIEEIIGADYETFVDLIYQSPDSSLNLLESKSDGDRKKFINRVNRLQELDDDFTRMKNREKELVGKNGKIAMLQKQVETLENGLTQLQPELDELDVTPQETFLKDLWKGFDELKERKLELLRTRQELEALISKAEANREATEELALLEQKLKEFPAELRYTPVIEAEHSELSARLTQEREVLSRARAVKEQLDQAQVALKRIEELEYELAVIKVPEHPPQFVVEQLQKISTLKTKTETGRAGRVVEAARLLESSQAGSCPTCGHTVAQDQFDKEIDTLKSQIAEDNALVEKCDASLVKYKEMQTTWMQIAAMKDELERHRAHPGTKIDGAKARAELGRAGLLVETTEFQLSAVTTELQHNRAFDRTVSEINRLRAQVGPEIDAEQARERLYAITEQLNEVIRNQSESEISIKSLDSDLKRMKDHNALARARRELNRQVAESNQGVSLRLALARSELAEAEATLEDIKNWLGILGPKGYRVRKIDKFLRNFNLTLKRYSDMITSGRYQCRFYLDDEGEVQFQVTDPYKSIKWAGWSKGQKARVKMGCLFATLEILEATGSSTYNVLALDEIFGSLDDEGKEGLFRVLSHLQHNGKAIYTIAHSELALAMVYDSVIHAVMHEDGTTSVSQ